MYRFARTARTYPVDVQSLVRAVKGTVRELPGWHLDAAGNRDLRAVRRTMAGSTEVRIVLVELESGAHTNTLAGLESRRTSGLPLPGQPRRDLDRLLSTLDETLKSGA